jgi:2-methylisocitrate lyase-like PEP mutase family enzyme
MLAESTNVPISVDLEHGYGTSPEAAANAVRLVAEAGAVGGSIEDFDGDAGELYDQSFAAERVAAAAEAARTLDVPFVLTARAENHWRGNPQLDDTISRLQAYEAAGADVLYAPRLVSANEIRALCDAVEKPVNALAHAGLTMKEMTDAGAQRISVGGNITWIAVEAMARSVQKMRDEGDFSDIQGGAQVAEWLSS